VERLVRSELERQNITVTHGQDRLVGFSGDMQTMVQANIWLRTANRVYIELEKITLTSFDGLFACIESIDWSQWIPGNTPINVSATSIRSVLSHTPTLQSVTKKAIIRRLSNGDDEWHENMFNQPIEIFILVVADEVHILVNTSGPALHKRGYRSQTGEAPIKESLAAAMVLLSGWKYKTPLYDPMCGSGTILIEAAMIARNIAPGLQRSFDYLQFPWGSSELHEETVRAAKAKIFDQSYALFGSDIDPAMLHIARENARQAGVADTITFSTSALTDVKYPQ
jgi:putative N6-adenine-specific DNA methylase